MRKHISIFTFLLSAFAAGLAPEAGAATTQTVYGGYYYYEQDYKSPRSIDRMYVEGSKPKSYTVGIAEGAQVTFVAVPPPAMVVSGWGIATSGTDVQKIRDWIDAATLSDPLKYTWAGKPSDGDRYLAVQFAYMPLVITFNGGDGGSGSMAKMEGLNIDYEFTLSANKFTKTGYRFAGWKTNETEGVIFADKATLTGSAFWNGKAFDSTLYAQWATNAYSVSCELNGGSWPADYAPPAKAIYDTVFSLPAPHRTGYDFIGWKVTSGLDSTTAKWGTGENPSTSITADTLCANGKNEVYFKNLNPTDKTTVTLTAQWQAATVRVTFNNEGGSSGGGILDYLDVKFGEPYPALNVPSKGGSLFRGYVIDGIEYWNAAAQATKTAWDIPTNCTAHALWETLAYQLTYNENRSDGTESKIEIRDFEYGKPTKLYDGADFSNLGCTLLGWSTNSKATKPDDGYEIGGTAIFVDSKTLYAVWEKNYFIAYDGNDATNETPMAVQKLVFGQPGQSLNPNTYGKVGYAFDGWATNRVAALLLDRAYKDREIITKDLATTVGETNTLFAVWATNTYYVAFDPNGGTGTAMGVRDYKYDTLFKLPAATYSNGAYDFFGWSNDVERVIYSDLTKPVSNLCAIADGTNTLYAVWKLSPLSAAMHCDNLRWESYQKTGETTRDNPWYPGSEGAYQYGDRSFHQQWLVAEVQTDGTISFDWKPNLCEDRPDQMIFWIGPEKDAGERQETKVSLEGVDGEWNSFVKAEVPAGSFIHIYVGSTAGNCTIDRMTWTPVGPEPVDGKDNVDISSAGISADGKFTLSFKSDEKFNYNLLTNADLLGGSWGVMGEKKIGDGSILTFEPKIIEGQPQLFYKVETIQRK